MWNNSQEVNNGHVPLYELTAHQSQIQFPLEMIPHRSYDSFNNIIIAYAVCIVYETYSNPPSTV